MTRPTLSMKKHIVVEKPKKVISKRIPYTEQVDGLDIYVMQLIEEKTPVLFTFLDGTHEAGIILERDRYAFRVEIDDDIVTIFKHSMRSYEAK
jgi:sRNA-binding regulator protein Hfq